MLRALLSATTALLCLLVIPDRLLADQLRDDYSILQDEREAIEDSREGVEESIDLQVDALDARKADWNRCADEIDYPLRACVDPYLITAGEQERDLSRKLGALEVHRNTLEGERLDLEGRRVAIEARFEVEGRGRRYESEFRAYMQDLTGYLGRADKLIPEYEQYLGSLGEYAVFVDEQAQACAVIEPESCELASRFSDLNAQQQQVRTERLEFSRRVNVTAHGDGLLPVMLVRAQRLWRRYTLIPRDWETTLEIERTSEKMTGERLALERQREALEMLRGESEIKRLEIEANRDEFEAGWIGRQRGNDYADGFNDVYLDPMKELRGREREIFEQFEEYEKAIIAYVAFVTYAAMPEATLTADAVALRADYADEFAKIESDVAEIERAVKSEGIRPVGKTDATTDSDSQMQERLAARTDSGGSGIPEPARNPSTSTLATLMRNSWQNLSDFVGG